MIPTTNLGFIYYLQNPTTGEIFYIGSTQTSLLSRLRTHYQHLREFERGLRNTNKRYVYLQNLKPLKATIHLLEIVTTGNLDERETYFIKLFRKLNPNLTNMTDGGTGRCTSKYYTEQQMEAFCKKMSLTNKGRAKPKGFGANLSKQRKGLGNPAAKELQDWIICFNKDVPEKLFKYGFEVNDFMNRSCAYGNVFKAMKYKTHNPYKRTWKFFSECNKNIQDIVHRDYESNRT